MSTNQYLLIFVIKTVSRCQRS